MRSIGYLLSKHVCVLLGLIGENFTTSFLLGLQDIRRQVITCRVGPAILRQLGFRSNDGHHWSGSLRVVTMPGREIEGLASALQLSATKALVGETECYSSAMFVATVKSRQQIVVVPAVRPTACLL